MAKKKIIAFFNAENEVAANVVELAEKYSCDGADGLFIYNYTGDEASREEFLGTLRLIEKKIDIPFIAGMYIERFEDAKKVLYTGASKVVIRRALMPDNDELDRIIKRFGSEKVAVEVDMKADFHDGDGLKALADWECCYEACGCGRQIHRGYGGMSYGAFYS